MKQGQATHSGSASTKTEPVSRAVNIPYVAECGIQTVRAVQVPMYEGRGLEAPMVGETSHKSGSQGRHK